MDRQKTLLMVGNGVLLAVLALGCDAVDGDAGADDIAFRPGSGAGGVWLNTNAIGTHAFSEIDLKENTHDGVRMVKVAVGVSEMNPAGLELEKLEFAANGQLQGKIGNTVYTGAGLVGSKWDLKLVVGPVETPAAMYISDYEEAEPGEMRYTFHYYDTNGDPQPVCDPDPTGDIAAVPIQDISVDATTGVVSQRADTLYLACTSGAVGKAVVWGYKPWQRTQDDFEAAIRMVRADYCYDGHSWTVPGTQIEVEDAWDINGFLNSSYVTESVWDKDGLRCLGTPRNGAYTQAQVTCGGQPVPSCAPGTDLSTYGGALFWVKNAAL